MDWNARIAALVIWLAVVFSSVINGNAEQRVVCYYTNWSVYRPGTAKFSPQNINPYLCTHLIYAFGGFTKDNTLKPFDKYQDIEKGGYAKFTGLKSYNKNLKTMLAIGGWNEGSSRFSPMVADPDRRKEFVKNSIKFLRQNHFDGLDLDWEYPAFRDGGKPRDRNNYADLVQELREEYDRESSKTGRTRLLLSMAVPAGIEYIDKGYDIPRLNDNLDFINLLSYDYHSAYEPAVNHHAPIYPLEEDNEYNYDSELTIDYTISHLIKSGASSEKIVLGIPTYGRSYTLINEEATDIGAPADGPGEEGDATREKGYLAYYEICESISKSDEWEVVQPNPNAMGPYAYRENQWVGYDDEDIVRAKARYVIEKKLGGIMFWSIDNDDFRGKCHGRPYPLIEAAKETLLAGTESNTGQKNKIPENRKKPGTRGNTINRKVGPGNRRTNVTQSSLPRRRPNSSKTKGRTNTRSRTRTNVKAENDDDEDDNENDDDDDDDEDARNAVKVAEKPRTRIRGKNRTKNRVVGESRRKQQQQQQKFRENEEKEIDERSSLSNSLTTPEPPTTPDPGSDFKCEDEGFFSHPRDCKKYFWCLDSGAGGLGVVAHQFTCPSGLVFNKGADACDYPRNVVCPKKISPTVVTTTKATTTSRRPNSQKTAKHTTTPEPNAEEEEYEYYEDEDVLESEEAKDEVSTTTTSKPLRYKTINRSRSTTTTSSTSTTTTEIPDESSTTSYKTTTDRSASFEDEEDPRVLKELIELIKKAGGIEQLEKQLNYQEKNSGNNTEKNENGEKSTPGPISRSLYERVLSRQATRIAGNLGSLGSPSTTQSTKREKIEKKAAKNSRIDFVNGPGGAQFEGLDDISEVKSLRRTSNRPTYVTIERHRSSTSETPIEKIEEDEKDEDDADDDNEDVVSSEERAVTDPPQRKNANRRVTPSYFNIRRPRPSSTTSENDVEVKDDDSNVEHSEEEAEEEEEPVTQRNRIVKSDEESTGPKSRYTNIHRFRSTTSRSSDVNKTDQVSEKNDVTTKPSTTTITTTTSKSIPTTEDNSDKFVPATTVLPTSTISESSVTSKLDDSTIIVEPSEIASTVPSTTETPLKLVEESATEILLTTASVSSSSMETIAESFTRGPIVAVVSQPRPFGFARRGRPTSTTTDSTSSVPAASTEQSRPKVVAERPGQPISKSSIGNNDATTLTIVDSTSAPGSSTTALVDTMIGNDTEKNYRTKSKNRSKIDDDDDRQEESSKDRDIFDNDVLESEEIQHRSFSTSFADVAATAHARSDESADRDRGINDTQDSLKRVEVPVQILDDDSGEAIAQLVILRIPENKFDSAILKPIFRVRILQSDNPTVNDENRNASVENSSENELYDVKSRVAINSGRDVPNFSTIAKKSDGRSDGNRRFRGRQRIVKARRRPVAKKVVDDDEYVKNNFNNSDDERFVRFSESTKNDTINRPYSIEDPTTVRVTTVRGNFSASSSKKSNGLRGFYITRGSDETDTTTSRSIVTDRSEFSTDLSSTTINDSVDDTIGSTDFTTPIREYSSIRQDEKNYPTTEATSIWDAIGKTNEDVTTGEANTIVYPEHRSAPTSNNFETVTDHVSTNGYGLGESFSTMITIPIEGKETVEELPTTKFPMIGSSERLTGQKIGDRRATNNDEFVIDVTEASKTSENNDHTTSTIFEGQTSNLTSKIISNEDGGSVATRDETSTMETTKVIDETTTLASSLKRGRVRFTTTLKPVARSTIPFSRGHQRGTTRSREYNREGIRSTQSIGNSDSEIGAIVDRRSTQSIGTTDSEIGAIVDRRSTQSIGTTDSEIDTIVDRRSTQPSVTKFSTIDRSNGLHEFVDEANRQSSNLGPSTLSLEDNDAGFYSVNPMEFTTKIGISTEENEKIKTTRESSQTWKLPIKSTDHTKETTESLEPNDNGINSVTPMEFTTKIGISIEDYEKMEKTSESSHTWKLPIESTDHTKLTTESLETNDNGINSVTPMEFTTKIGISIEDYERMEKTSEPSHTWKLPIESTDHTKRTTESLETNDDGINSVTPMDVIATTDFATKSYKTVESSITASDAKKSMTSFEDVDVTSYDPTLLSAIDDDVSRRTTMFVIKDEKPTSTSPSRFPSTGLWDKIDVRSESQRSTEITSTDSTGVVESRISTNFFTDEDRTIASTTSNESIVTVSIPAERYEKSADRSVGNKDENSNFTDTIDDPTYTTIFSDKNDASTMTENTGFLNVTPETTAAPSWIIFNDTTIAPTPMGLTPSESLSSTMEFHRRESDDSTSTIVKNETIVDRNAQRQIVSTDFEATTSIVDAKLRENTDTTEFKMADTSSENSIASTTTTSDNDQTMKSVTHSLANSVADVTTRRTNGNRGRVTFTNFAGNADEIGTRRRSVKQVIVRRRLADKSNNQRLAKIGDRKNATNLKSPKIGKDDEIQKTNEKNNTEEIFPKSLRRRVIILRGKMRHDETTTTIGQSTKFSGNDFTNDIGMKPIRRKWKKKIVNKRPRNDYMDDQIIAETGDFRRLLTDDRLDEDSGSIGKHITEPVLSDNVDSPEPEDEDIGDREVNIYRSSGNFLRRPGTLIRKDVTNRLRPIYAGTSLPGNRATGQPVPFSKIRSADTVEEIKSDDQSGRAQELAVTLADPPEISATANVGRKSFRTSTRKISTTIAPRTEAPPILHTTMISRRRQRPRSNVKIAETVSIRPRRPAIIDYDYYVDGEVRLVDKPELKDKLFVNGKGGINCLDQGNFAHPESCKKFISCAKMVNGLVVGTEYTCPNKLSFDPVGGICNWSAGVGCEDKA